jgi:hypothetical protein
MASLSSLSLISFEGDTGNRPFRDYSRHDALGQRATTLQMPQKWPPPLGLYILSLSFHGTPNAAAGKPTLLEIKKSTLGMREKGQYS